MVPPLTCPLTKQPQHLSLLKMDIIIILIVAGDVKDVVEDEVKMGVVATPISTHSNGSSKSNNVAKPCANRASPRVPCHIYNRTGHSALDCYHRMDFSYQERHPPIKLVAMAASNQLLGKQN